MGCMLYSMNGFEIIWTLFSDNLIEYLFPFQINFQAYSFSQ